MRRNVTVGKLCLSAGTALFMVGGLTPFGGGAVAMLLGGVGLACFGWSAIGNSEEG